LLFNHGVVVLKSRRGIRVVTFRQKLQIFHRILTKWQIFYKKIWLLSEKKLKFVFEFFENGNFSPKCCHFWTKIFKQNNFPTAINFGASVCLPPVTKPNLLSVADGGTLGLGVKTFKLGFDRQSIKRGHLRAFFVIHVSVPPVRRDVILTHL